MGNQTEMEEENPMSQVDGMSSTTYLRISLPRPLRCLAYGDGKGI